MPDNTKLPASTSNTKPDTAPSLAYDAPSTTDAPKAHASHDDTVTKAAHNRGLKRTKLLEARVDHLYRALDISGDPGSDDEDTSE